MMLHSAATFITFGLLALSIFAVWLRPIHMGMRAIPPWIALFCSALIAGAVAGFLAWMAIVEIGIFTVCAYFAGHLKTRRIWRMFFIILTALFALALAAHQLPGFHNPLLIVGIKLSDDAMPFTQYANFDKAAVGLIILAFFCRRVGNAYDWRVVLRRSLPIGAATTIVVIGTAIIAGHIKPDFKLSGYTLIFLFTNLLFTCVAEEAFFRGFLQEQFEKFFSSLRTGRVIAAVISAALFGATHFGGDAMYVLLAMLAGLGYAYAYLVTRRVEAPIIVHFVLNAVHFIAFTYPQLQ